MANAAYIRLDLPDEATELFSKVQSDTDVDTGAVLSTFPISPVLTCADMALELNAMTAAPEPLPNSAILTLNLP
jgi:hypothetical protein